MAKSIRSKRKRKMRAAMRKKIEPKILDQLKKTIGKDGSLDVEMKELVTEKDISTMDTSEKAKYNKKTLKDKDGNYPKWMNSRQMKRLQSKNKRKGKKSKSLIKGKQKKKS